MPPRRIDKIRLFVLVTGVFSGAAASLLISSSWVPTKELLAGAAGAFATLAGFILTVQTILVSLSASNNDSKRSEIIFRVKRLYVFFILHASGLAVSLTALALQGYVGAVPDTFTRSFLFISPLALVTALEIPRTMWASYRMAS